MKAKQLETIKQQHARYIANAKHPSKPSTRDQILRALVNGSTLTLKSKADIIAMCRDEIVKERYGSRSIAIEDLFTTDSAHRASKIADAAKSKPP